MARGRFRSLLALLALLALALAACGGEADAGGGSPDGVGADGTATADVVGGNGGGGADGAAVGDVQKDAEPPSPWAVTQVLPSKGSAYGGDLVAVAGRGFVDGVRVFFGDDEGRNVFVVTDAYLEVRTPRGAAGFVDVRVEWPSDPERVRPAGTVAVLEGGFLYELPVRVVSIEPAEGPADGGTPIVVRGEGFAPDSRIVIGGRQALEIRVADEHTLIALTPPAAELGSADVYVGGALGFGVLRGGFAYRAKARVDGVAPPYGPVSGGAAAAVAGAGLEGATSVFFGGGRATVGAVADDRIDVSTPVGAIGPVDVAATSPWGTAIRAGGYVFTDEDPAQRSLALLGAVPTEGDTAGGDRVTLVVQGLRGVGPAAVDVTVGGRAATVVGVGEADVRIDTPPGALGAADITVTTPDGETTLTGGFVYRAPLSILAVDPGQGPTAGGTTLVVRGAGFDAGVDEVRVGALAATGVVVASDDRLEAISPPGTSGRVDVVVRRGDREARLGGAFEYRADRPTLVALDPTSGSVSGGTNVHLYGSGFGVQPAISFGTRTGELVEVVDDGHLIVRTPAAPQGTVDVTVARGTASSTLPAAFTYFAPDTGSGGTWGGPVAGVVNVAVLDVYTEEGVEGAYVTLGDPATTEHRGYTDAAGRITFSGTDLNGRQEVSAAHPDYSAASVVEFDAENVTLLLFPHFPPNVGPPPDFANLGPGRITGKVLWDDKYRLIPYGDCSVRQPDGVLCLPCASDDDCAEDGGVCTRIGQTGRFCTLPCTTIGGDGVIGADHDACPNEYTCTHMGSTKGFQCVPVAGDVIIRCETTRPYPGGQIPPAGQGMFVGPDMLYSIESRLEELAVVCVAAQQKVPLGPAEPFLMGVRRRIQVQSRQNLVAQDVILDTPLRSTLRVRLEESPPHPFGEDVWMVTPYVDFGAEGVWKLGVPLYGGRGDDLFELPRMPGGFTGSLAGTSFAVSVTQFDRFDSESHFSKSWKWGIADLDDDSVLRWDGEGWQIEELGDTLDAGAFATDGDGRLFAVGADGRVTRREGGVWFVEATPVKSELYAAATDGAGFVYAAGQDGTLLRRRESGWRFVEGAPSVNLYALAAAPDGSLVAAGDRGVAGRIEDSVFRPLDTGTDWPLYAALAREGGELWFAGENGRVVRVVDDVPEAVDLPEATDARALVETPAGEVLVITDAGGAFRWDGAGWVEEDTGVAADLYGATILDGKVVAVGDRGTVLRRDAADAWTAIGRPGYTADLRAIAATPDGAAFTGGLHGIMVAPILGVPRMEATRYGATSGMTLEWVVPPSGTPTIQHIAIVSNSGYPIWDVFLDPDVRIVELPDFETLAGFDPLEGSMLLLTLRRIYHPSIDIDRFTFWDVWFGDFWPALAETSVVLQRPE